MNVTDKAVLLSDIEFVEMHSDDWERIERESFEIQKQLELNENQQIVLEWLKDKYTITDIEPIELFWRLHVNTKNKFRTLLAYRAYKSLTRKAQLEVLSAFAQWALEQEEE